MRIAITALTVMASLLTAANLQAQSYEQGLSQASDKIAQSLASRNGQIATVLDLNGLDGTTTQLGKLVAQDVFDQLVSSASNVTWIDPSRRDFVVQENQLAADRLMDPVTQKQLGKLLGLSLIVTGTVTELGDSARIQLRAVEIETARVVGSASTTVELPEALKRLNDRRASAPARSGSNLQSDLLEFQVSRLDLMSGGKDSNYLFVVTSTFSIMNRSGSDIWLLMSGLSLGACQYGGRVFSAFSSTQPQFINGVKFYPRINTNLSHEERKPDYTPLPAGATAMVSVRILCPLENLPTFTSGVTNLVSEIAVDFGDRMEQRSFSVSDVEVTSNSAN